MPAVLNTILAFILNVAFDLYIFIVLLRFLLQFVGTDYYNPLSQWILRLTRWTVTLLQQVIPSYRHINIAAILLALLLESLKIIGLLLLNNKFFPHIPGTLLWAFADLLNYTVHLFIYAIFGQVILSWIRPARAMVLLQIIDRLTSPILRPFQKIIPSFAGLDFSPIVALIFLKLIVAYGILPLQIFASQLAFSGG